MRGRAAEGGRGSLTHHLELELSNTPLQPWLHSVSATRLETRGPNSFTRSLAGAYRKGTKSSHIAFKLSDFYRPEDTKVTVVGLRKDFA
jgi:hypothetical protein